jgi:hypothetical protein
VRKIMSVIRVNTGNRRYRDAGGGTGLMGYVDTTYQNLIATFGEPGDGDGYKFHAEWILSTPAGVATIYDYKESQPVEDVTNWHVGGHNARVITYVEDALIGLIEVVR